MTVIPKPVIDTVVARFGTEHVHAGFDPLHTALLVIDMQMAFLDERIGHAVCVPARAIIPAINRLAGAIRQGGGHVVWLKNIHDREMQKGWSNLYAMLGENGTAARARALSPDAPGFALSPELDVSEGDDVVVKRRFSAFLQGSSDLEARLRARGIDTLVVAGCTTDVCVESTARDAMMLNFKVIVASDATAAMTESAHVAALSALYLNFADVMPSAMIADQAASG